MNKKQEILDCIKTLNITQEQANRLADVLASGGEGGSNKSVKIFKSHQEGDLTTFKVNDNEIPFTKGNEGDIGTVYLINEQDFNYIENNIKECVEMQLEELYGDDCYNSIIGVKFLYNLEDVNKVYILEGASLEGYSTTIFMLVKNDYKYYFKLY